VSCPLGARRIAQERQHPLRTHLAQACEPGPPAPHRGVVELEVPGMDNGAVRRVQNDADGVGNIVVDMEEFNADAAQTQF